MNASAAAALPESGLEPLRVALLGSPNSGKTTLFNALTGSRAKVANYSGVTVERREGGFDVDGRPVRIIDLPGTYSLDAETPDEAIAVAALEGTIAGEPRPDALLVVVDATTLERGLGLVLQALHEKLPTLLVLSMIDEVQARGHHLDVPGLGRKLGIHAIGVVGHRGIGLDQIRRALTKYEKWPVPRSLPDVHDPRARFALVDELLAEVSKATTASDPRTEKLDRVLLHPVAGIAIFATVMVGLFQSIFTLAVPLMDGIDASFAWLGDTSRAVLPAGLLTDLWVDGIVAGVGSVVIFLPQIMILFLLIHLLEDVGYMARAAFIVDRVMGWVGLQGRSFVSLLSSYACAVPGIMSARAISSPRDRLATILVAPFMTCSARLPVYALLIAAFVPARPVAGVLNLQGLVMLGLYLLGTFTAFASAALVNRTLLKGTPARFYMELPPYRMPTAKLLLTQMWGSARAFLRRAGTIIFVVSIVLWALLTFPRLDADAPQLVGLDATAVAQMHLEHSAAARLGKLIEPAIAPLGYDWKIGVGLIASLAAREVIVATLAQVYAIGDPDDFAGLRAHLIADPAFTLATALSLLVFFVFALQCTSTIAVMARETGSWKWPAIAFSYMLMLAWGGAFVTYHVATALL